MCARHLSDGVTRASLRMPANRKLVPLLEKSYLPRYTLVVEIFRTGVYEKWFRRLKDTQARARIDIALRRCSLAGQVVGDTKSVGAGVFELRIHVGPGYRVYYVAHGDQMMLLLVGGDKTTQRRDIEKAKQIARELREDDKWT